MTPRESLEAAGMCSDCESNQCAASCRCPCHQKNANQAARLARDEAKETSDGSVKEKVQLETVSVRCVSSVAGNIATQNYIQNSIQAAPVATSVSVPDAKKKDAWDIAYPWVEDGAQAAQLAVEIEAYAREYASSSSAPLVNRPTDDKTPVASEHQRSIESVSVPTEAELEKQWIADGSTNSFKTWLIRKVAELQDWKESQMAVTPDYQEIGKLLDVQWGESVHDKIIPGIRALRDSRDRLQGQAAELRGQLEVRETLAAADLEKLKELEDNSAQDEREIEALQESLRTVRQDLADRDGIIIGLQDVAAGKTRPLTDIEAELRGNKS